MSTDNNSVRLRNDLTFGLALLALVAFVLGWEVVASLATLGWLACNADAGHLKDRWRGYARGVVRRVAGAGRRGRARRRSPGRA